MTNQTSRLKVCSYNIHKGYNSLNSQLLLSAMRQAMQQTQADLLCLQEVIGAHCRKAHTPAATDHLTQCDYLAEASWPHIAYGKNAIHQHGHHGNAILSRWPLESWQNLDISYWKTLSQRGILHSRLSTGVEVFCVHMGLLAVERRYQMRRLIEMIARETSPQAPLIIAGDFNDWTLAIDRQLRARLKLSLALPAGHTRPLATFPARYPLLAMDRIYFRNLELLDCAMLRGQPWQQLSDHCPVIAEFVC